MLKKSHITKITLLSDEWYTHRLAKFTSSEIHYLTGVKGLGSAGYKYIYRKVGEELSARQSREQVDTEATRHGTLYEKEALDKFCQAKGIKWYISQTLISIPNTRFSSTPDGILILQEAQNQEEYIVETTEVKCPLSYDGYIELALCNTPDDVKKIKHEHYWQVIDQMIVCGAMKGYLIIYQPHFRAGSLKIIEFSQLELRNDFKLLKERKELAVKEFESIRDKLLKL